MTWMTLYNEYKSKTGRFSDKVSSQHTAHPPKLPSSTPGPSQGGPGPSSSGGKKKMSTEAIVEIFEANEAEHPKGFTNAIGRTLAGM
ncbi:MAG: hypothetical protein Q9228_008018, partial [Teloschistes exilis]